MTRELSRDKEIGVLEFRFFNPFITPYNKDDKQYVYLEFGKQTKTRENLGYSKILKAERYKTRMFIEDTHEIKEELPHECKDCQVPNYENENHIPKKNEDL